MKRFKPTPVGGSGDETSLKIRFSRYNAAPGRSQTKNSTLPQEGSNVAPSPPNTPQPRSPRPTRVTRGRAAGSQDSYDESSPVKQEQMKSIESSSVKSCEVRMSPLDSIKHESEFETESKPHPTPWITYDMSASEIVNECERVGPGSGPISTSILDIQEIPLPKRRHELPKLTPDQLLPPTPCVHVKTKQDAFSPQLLDWCLQRPITVIRGLAQACEIDLGLYTTKTLVESHPNHPVEIRTQLEQSSDENWAPSMQEQVRLNNCNFQNPYLVKMENVNFDKVCIMMCRSFIMF